MKLSLTPRPVLILAASAALALATPCALHAQQPLASPNPSEADVFDVIKKGADRLQKQAKEAKELSPKVKLLEERQNDLHKKVVEMEQRLAKQQEIIDHLHHEVEKLETAASKPVPPPPTAEVPPAPHVAPPAPPVAPPPGAPGAPLPVTEPPVKPAPTPGS